MRILRRRWPFVAITRIATAGFYATEKSGLSYILTFIEPVLMLIFMLVLYKGYIITSDNSMTINYYDTSTNSTYEFTINYTKNNEEITTPDLTNSINSNDMTLDDTMEIMSKLQENKKLEKFITDLGLIES